MIGVKFLVLRNGVPYTELKADKSTGAQVSMDNTAEIKMTMTGTFEVNPKINMLTDRLQVVMSINEVEYPLGKYVITDMQPSKSATRTTGEYTGYDLTYLVSSSTTEQRHYIKAGTKYTDAIQELLITAGITDFIIDTNTAKIRNDREDWEPGTSRLEIINTLLAEINYNSLWMDLNGVVRCTPYRQATAANVDHVYDLQKGLLYPETSQMLDCFNRANVFIREVEGAEDVAALRAVSVNDDPQSEFSTVNQRRRIVDYDTMDNIASQAELQAYVDNLKFKSLLSPVETTFYTAPSPTHNAFDIVALGEQEDMGFTTEYGIYAETSWALDLYAPWKMEHTGKRIIKAVV